MTEEEFMAYLDGQLCVMCGRGQKERPMCFQNEDWCSENCRKATIGEPPIPERLSS